MFESIKEISRFFPATHELGERLKTAELEDQYNVFHLVGLAKILGYPSMFIADMFLFNWIQLANLVFKSLEA